MTRAGNGAGPGTTRGRRRERPPLPRHPYRDSALLHAVLALLIVVITLLTDGSPITGVLVAIAYFVLATAWSWLRFSRRIKEQGAQAESRTGARSKT